MSVPNPAPRTLLDGTDAANDDAVTEENKAEFGTNIDASPVMTRMCTTGAVRQNMLQI